MSLAHNIKNVCSKTVGNEKGPNAQSISLTLSSWRQIIFLKAVGDLIEISEKMEDEEEGMEGVEDKEWQEEE